MKNLSLVGFALIMIAGLCFIAGGPTIRLLPQGTANFLGITFGVLATICWVAYGMNRKPEDQTETAE
jgi:drug/metabolite transporter (DMT)-like permease